MRTNSDVLFIHQNAEEHLNNISIHMPGWCLMVYYLFCAAVTHKLTLACCNEKITNFCWRWHLLPAEKWPDTVLSSDYCQVCDFMCFSSEADHDYILQYLKSTYLRYISLWIFACFFCKCSSHSPVTALAISYATYMTSKESKTLQLSWCWECKATYLLQITSAAWHCLSFRLAMW